MSYYELLKPWNWLFGCELLTNHIDKTILDTYPNPTDFNANKIINFTIMENTVLQSYNSTHLKCYSNGKKLEVCEDKNEDNDYNLFIIRTEQDVPPDTTSNFRGGVVYFYFAFQNEGFYNVNKIIIEKKKYVNHIIVIINNISTSGYYGLNDNINQPSLIPTEAPVEPTNKSIYDPLSTACKSCTRTTVCINCIGTQVIAPNIDYDFTTFYPETFEEVFNVNDTFIITMTNKPKYSKLYLYISSSTGIISWKKLQMPEFGYIDFDKNYYSPDNSNLDGDTYQFQFIKKDVYFWDKNIII